MLQSILRALNPNNIELIPARIYVLLNPDKVKRGHPGYPVLAGWPEWLPKPALFPHMKVHVKGMDPRR